MSKPALRLAESSYIFEDLGAATRFLLGYIRTQNLRERSRVSHSIGKRLGFRLFGEERRCIVSVLGQGRSMI